MADLADDGQLAIYAPANRAALRPLRRMILEIAASVPEIGALCESLKWGEPSFSPERRGIGSSVRLAPRADGKVSMHFICHTGLVDQFRALYSGKLDFEGNRTIIVDPAGPIPEEELRHCIAKALTYHLARKSKTR